MPITQVETKFIDDNQVRSLIHCLNRKYNAKAWPIPSWQRHPKKLSGLSLLQIDERTRLHYTLSAKHILVVESVQSDLGIPELPDTIVVFGGGKNINWLAADWLNEKRWIDMTWVTIKYLMLLFTGTG